MRRIVIGIAALAAPLAPAVADEPAPPAAATAEPDAETLAAALALFDGPDLEDQLLAAALHMAQTSLETDIEAWKARDVEFPDRLAKRLQEFILAETKAMVEDMAPTYRTDAAAIYARHFTADELRELKRLQDNPVMKKAEKLSPLLMSELSRIGMKVSAERMPDIQRRGQELVEQWLVEETMAAEGPTT